MDDSLEQPDAKPPTVTPEGISAEDGDHASDDEGDVVLDWTKLLPSSARPVIPRRGEKEFEPQPGGGSGLQVHVLDRSRNAMFDALRATRTISSKAVSYAMWHPDLARAHVIVARGTLFTSIGHSAPRLVVTADGAEKYHKRMELLPEEALYLIERGTVFCWKEANLDLTGVDGLEDVLGPPMSVQQAFSEMIGTEDLTLERYQVYAYLKRLGYVVTRATAPNSLYPMPPPFDLSPLNQKSRSILNRIVSIFPLWFTKASRFLSGGFNWWKPFRMNRWLLQAKNYGYRNYGTIFRALRFIPAGHGIPLLPTKSEPPAKPSPYRIFFNVHKPATPYRKSAPCLPDYQITVINARTTPMPTLRELTDLFDISPEMPPPLPRQRRPLKGAAPPLFNPKPVPAPPPLSVSRRILYWFRPPPPESTVPARRPHPFMAIKAGRKTVVIAVCDAGSTSFFRFGQGAFSEWALT
ncbi:tRNA-splicing endonuclease subunit sen54 N-term-domain-containing protein [Mycena maculata]|uniref:tRNA-splicing endonuclease subunit sen54 N-term-domain-containing protein n=1 Tax=Mycena maculata TaxID=230809 RepID=A0AAD7JXH2_9AGAR|nr:tRNA-splicing endonuclease subunit sen54 N-term-domain-containing protein [Mycena maculata]